VTLPYTLANGSAADASEVQANFTALEGRIGNVKNADISLAASIDLTKLASPNSVLTMVIPLFGRLNTTGAAGAAGTFIGETAGTGKFGIKQDAMTSVGRKIRFRNRSGRQAFLCSAEWYVGYSEAGATAGKPKLDLLVGGVQVSGQAFEVDTSDDYYVIAAASPFDSPIMPVNDLDVIDPRVGATGGGGGGNTPFLADVVLTLVFKLGAIP
jgi:hypothetical protein